jgi:hypothetical protein
MVDIDQEVDQAIEEEEDRDKKGRESPGSEWKTKSLDTFREENSCLSTLMRAWEISARAWPKGRRSSSIRGVMNHDMNMHTNGRG